MAGLHDARPNAGRVEKTNKTKMSLPTRRRTRLGLQMQAACTSRIQRGSPSSTDFDLAEVRVPHSTFMNTPYQDLIPRVLSWQPFVRP